MIYKKPKFEYLTPEEVLERYPQLVEVHGISDSMLGSFLKCHVLWGTYDSSKRKAKIREDSVLRLIQFIDDGLISMLILKKMT
jgi:hypothetical protein